MILIRIVTAGSESELLKSVMLACSESELSESVVSACSESELVVSVCSESESLVKGLFGLFSVAASSGGVVRSL